MNYALILQPSRAVEEKIKAVLTQRNDYSINYTNAEYLRFKPIAVSFETKRAVEEDSGSKK